MGIDSGEERHCTARHVDAQKHDEYDDFYFVVTGPADGEAGRPVGDLSNPLPPTQQNKNFVELRGGEKPHGPQ
nr:hypothetical protein [uncultured Flavonifractor sp.]